MIKASWEIKMEQDVKALYDINIQTQLINIISDQISASIDQDIIRDIISNMEKFERLEKDKHISDMNEEEIKTHISDIFGVMNNV